MAAIEKDLRVNPHSSSSHKRPLEEPLAAPHQSSTPIVSIAQTAISQLAYPLKGDNPSLGALLNPEPHRSASSNTISLTPISTTPDFRFVTTVVNTTEEVAKRIKPSKKSSVFQANGLDPAEEEILKTLLAAKDLCGERKYVEALSILKPISQIKIRSADFFILLGDCYQGIGEYTLTIENYEKAHSYLNGKSEKCAELFYKQAQCYLTLQTLIPEQAVKLRDIAKAFINKALTNSRISVMLETQLTGLLRKTLSRTEKKNLSSLALSKCFDGQSSLKRGNNKAAITHFEKAIESAQTVFSEQIQIPVITEKTLYDSLADSYKYLAAAHMSLKNFDSYVQAWNMCILHQDRSDVKIELIQRLAIAYVSKNKFDEAIQLIREATGGKFSNKENETLTLFLIDLLEKNGEIDQAYSLLEAMILDSEKKFTQDAQLDACIKLGSVYYNHKKFDQYKNLMLIGSSFYHADVATKARFYTMFGHGMEGLAHYAATDGNELQAKQFIGKAIDLFEFALKCEIPDQKGYLCLQLARVQKKDGRLPEAIATCLEGAAFTLKADTKSELLKYAETLKEDLKENEAISALEGLK